MIISGRPTVKEPYYWIQVGYNPTDHNPNVLFELGFRIALGINSLHI